ncbi:MAG: response regulator [bacterium]
MSKSILIVDDNPNMSALLSEMLEIFDYESVQAEDGPQALEKLQAGEFAMVISDLRMPNMTGLELLQKVKAQYPDMPVVIISGYNMTVGETADDPQPDGFLAKPFMMADVEKLLGELL